MQEPLGDGRLRSWELRSDLGFHKISGFDFHRILLDLDLDLDLAGFGFDLDSDLV